MDDDDSGHAWVSLAKRPTPQRNSAPVGTMLALRGAMRCVAQGGPYPHGLHLRGLQIHERAFAHQ